MFPQLATLPHSVGGEMHKNLDHVQLFCLWLCHFQPPNKTPIAFNFAPPSQFVILEENSIHSPLRQNQASRWPLLKPIFFLAQLIQHNYQKLSRGIFGLGGGRCTPAFLLLLLRQRFPHRLRKLLKLCGEVRGRCWHDVLGGDRHRQHHGGFLRSLSWCCRQAVAVSFGGQLPGARGGMQHELTHKQKTRQKMQKVKKKTTQKAKKNNANCMKYPSGAPEM